MNNIVYNLLLKLEQCDDKHKRCDYLMEHDEITYLLEHVKMLEERRKQNIKYKEVLDKALYWLSENTHYTDFNVDKLVLDENANLKELLELLEEIE